MKTIEDIRTEYELAGLGEADIARDPFEQFGRWYDEARASGIHEPNAMTLATIGPNGPSARVVLLRGFDTRGFTFFTNYESDKGRELAGDARVALCIAWIDIARQVRVEGVASKVSREETDDYFRTRPRASQLGAWASAQSRPVASRAELESRYAELVTEYEGREVPAPPHWGGYRVAPVRIEFWQGRPSRMHDRIRYELDGTSWRIKRLAP